MSSLEQLQKALEQLGKYLRGLDRINIPDKQVYNPDSYDEHLFGGAHHTYASEISLKEYVGQAVKAGESIVKLFSAFMREQTVREQKLRKLWEERPRGKTIHEQNPNISDSDLIRVFFIEYIKWELEFLEVEFEKVFDDSTPAEETKQ